MTPSQAGSPPRPGASQGRPAHAVMAVCRIPLAAAVGQGPGVGALAPKVAGFRLCRRGPGPRQTGIIGGRGLAGRPTGKQPGHHDYGMGGPPCPWPDPPAESGSRRAEGKCGGCGGSQIRSSRPAEDSEPVPRDCSRRECASDGSQVRALWHGGKRRWPATASWPAWTHEGTPSRVRCMRIAPEMFTMRFCQCTFPGRSILLRRSFGQSRQRYSATDSAAPRSCRLYVASLFAPAINAQRHSTVHERKECRIHSGTSRREVPSSREQHDTSAPEPLLQPLALDWTGHRTTRATLRA